MPGARWFPEARVNFAENLLRECRNREALVFWGEDKQERRLTRDELRQNVGRFMYRANPLCQPFDCTRLRPMMPTNLVVGAKIFARYSLKSGNSDNPPCRADQSAGWSRKLSTSARVVVSK